MRFFTFNILYVFKCFSNFLQIRELFQNFVSLFMTGNQAPRIFLSGSCNSLLTIYRLCAKSNFGLKDNQLCFLRGVDVPRIFYAWELLHVLRF
jgi:hypothetical protein